MKALTFLEWYFTQKGNYRWYDNQNEFINHTYKVLDFYNQPFTVDMLVNPVMADGVNIKPLIQQSESLRLFEGWEENGELSFLYIYNKNHTVIVDFCETSICFRENDNYELNDYYFYCGYNNITLNDFITLCNLAGIELRFNKSNETIKKLFGEDKK